MNDAQSDRIEQLIDQLGDPSSERAEDAKAELAALGGIVLDQLLARFPDLDPFAQLCCIEIFRELRCVRAGDSLIARLRSDNGVVRGWSADALGTLGVVEAVPHLRRLLAERKAAGEPPDWTESVFARHALTRLEARQPVVPNELAALFVNAEPLQFAVRDPDLERAIDALAVAGQVIAYYQRWRPCQPTWCYVDSSSFDLDWTGEWNKLVESSHRAAMDDAARRAVDSTYVVAIEWLGAQDWVDL